MTADNAGTRASDADRDQTAASLREHYAAGRLTGEEFSDRLDKVTRQTRAGLVLTGNGGIRATALVPAGVQPGRPVG